MQQLDRKLNTNSRPNPTTALNSGRSKYHFFMSSLLVRAFHTLATGALKVRSMTIVPSFILKWSSESHFFKVRQVALEAIHVLGHAFASSVFPDYMIEFFFRPE